MKDTFSTSFYIRGSRLDKNGMALIYLRITVNGKRSELSLQRKVKPDRWDSKKGRVRGTIPSILQLNRFLDNITSKVYQIQGEFISDGIPYTSDMLLNTFQGKGNHQKTLQSIYGEHNGELSELVGREFSSRAYQRHLRTARHLQAFIKKEYGYEDISVKKIDLRFINRFEHFLKTSLKNCGQNTVTKYVTNLKKIMRICYANDWISKDPFYHWKAKWKKWNATSSMKGN